MGLTCERSPKRRFFIVSGVVFAALGLKLGRLPRRFHGKARGRVCDKRGVGIYRGEWGCDDIIIKSDQAEAIEALMRDDDDGRP